MLLVKRPPYTDMMYLETTQTHFKPNANRGWPTKLVNQIHPQINGLYLKSSWSPTSQMQMGHPHTEDLNTMGL